MAPLDYLVIAPHPDDAELGAGGSIALLQAQGAKVGILDLTDGEPTPLGSPEIRQRETAAATEVLGLAWRGNLGLTNRRLEATLLGRRPSRSRRRQRSRRCGAFLGQAHALRFAGRAALSQTNPLLF
jgi:LmbE family N-acetylglucosaminyl deacetylase